MSPLVKTKRQANFKDFKRFGAFKGLVKQKNVVFNSFVCQLRFFWHSSNKLLLPLCEMHYFTELKWFKTNGFIRLEIISHIISQVQNFLSEIFLLMNENIHK
jgi:hypothetical protein